MPREARRRWLIPTAVGLLAFLCYAPSLANGFALDDVPAVQQDERIRSLGALPGLFAEPYLTYMPIERSPYRPVTTASYVLSWAAGGGHPLPFHLFNVLAHVAATLLLLSTLVALGSTHPVAGAGAALFAVHPVHTEAVAGVVGRADVLAALFSLLALRVFLARDVGGLSNAALIALAYLLALGSKESAIVLPALLVVVALVRPASPRPDGESADLEQRLRPTLAPLFAMVVVAAGYLAWRGQVLGGVVQLDVASYIAALPGTPRITTAVANFSEVGRLLLFPLDLSAEYGPELIVPAGPADPRFWAGVAVAAGAVGVAVWGLRAAGPARLAAAGVAWFAICFALLSNVVLPLPMWLAERTLYLGSAGAVLVVVGALSHHGWKPGRNTVTAGLAAWIAFGLVRSATYATVWADDETLFTDLVERHPESFRAQWWLGGRMVDAGNVTGGVLWLERAARSNPNGALLQLDYARALLLLDRSAEAEVVLRPIPAGLHESVSVFLAQSLIFQDRADEAIPVVEEGLRRFPNEPRLLGQATQLGIR